MMTLDAMSKNAYLTFKLSQTNSLFANAAKPSFFDFTGSGSKQNNSSFDSINISTNTASLQNALSAQLATHKDTIAKIDEYNKVSDKFYSEFFPTMDKLKDSASNLKQLDFANGDVTKITNSVTEFATSYNNNIDFLAKNSKTSTKIADLANTFSSAKYNSKALAAIGVNVDAKGKLNIDADKLSAALAKDSKNVSQTIGSQGIAGQTYNKVNAAVKNSANLIPFPSLKNNNFNGLSQGMLLDLFV